MAKWKNKRNTIHHYDQLAEVYDTQYADEQKAKIEAVLENTSLAKSDFVLDVGCGTGLLFPYVASKVQLLIGIDTSQGLLEKAETRKESFANVHILLADADHLPFRRWNFNTTFAITLLQNSPNPLITLQEIERVSKKHATIMVTGLKKKFTQQTFIATLENAKLELSTLDTDNNLKDYIAKCHFRN